MYDLLIERRAEKSIRNLLKEIAGNKRLDYKDNAFPTYNSLTTSAPSVIAKMIYHTGVKKGDKVLEVGTGTGYQAAVLCEMGINVYSIEIDKKIIKAANKILLELGYKTDEQFKSKYFCYGRYVFSVCEDGFKG